MPSMLYALALLACPIGIGLMMFLMMRGQSPADQTENDPADHREVDSLRAEIEALKAQRVADTPQPLP
ncbi:hypothetical protein [Mycolicibacterium mageritense]|uniref:hypothetical protein n=1 Tax=Mycolicibacterium mageritense TaxID=53462 RepID=UPI0011D6D72B|nr:hypothetical protein [Mycolicibacterium mageritense]TXI61485.1 MAG: hypothetical protein E6Q55_16025 [Mycolicibacterium mageritense]